MHSPCLLLGFRTASQAREPAGVTGPVFTQEQFWLMVSQHSASTCAACLSHPCITMKFAFLSLLLTAGKCVLGNTEC